MLTWFSATADNSYLNSYLNILLRVTKFHSHS